jgi:hypothetical protein
MAGATPTPIILLAPQFYMSRKIHAKAKVAGLSAGKMNIINQMTTKT